MPLPLVKLPRTTGGLETVETGTAFMPFLDCHTCSIYVSFDLSKLRDDYME